jgi:hypothetical protein
MTRASSAGKSDDHDPLGIRILCAACGCRIDAPDMSARIIVCAECATAPALPESDLDPPDYGSRAAVRACPSYRNRHCTKSGKLCLIMAVPPTCCPDLTPIIAREVYLAQCRDCRTLLRPGKRVCATCQMQKRREQMRMLMARRRRGVTSTAVVSEND